jgi:hypothetical protein
MYIGRNAFRNWRDPDPPDDRVNYGAPRPSLMTRHHLWLLLPRYVGLLWLPFYNFHDPVLFGFPFFYWYQLAWGTGDCVSDLDCLPDVLP